MALSGGVLVGLGSNLLANQIGDESSKDLH
jgi:hypothetical protein